MLKLLIAHSILLQTSHHLLELLRRVLKVLASFAGHLCLQLHHSLSGLVNQVTVAGPVSILVGLDPLLHHFFLCLLELIHNVLRDDLLQLEGASGRQQPRKAFVELGHVVVNRFEEQEFGRIVLFILRGVFLLHHIVKGQLVYTVIVVHCLLLLVVKVVGDKRDAPAGGSDDPDLRVFFLGWRISCSY